MRAPFRRLFAPVSAGALALGLVLGLTGPLVVGWLRAGEPEHRLPEGYVGVLSAPEGTTAVVVSALRRGRVLDTRLPTPPTMPQGRTLFLWTVDTAGAVLPVGPVPTAARGAIDLADRAEQVLADTVLFGVSVERTGTSPDRPTGAFVFRGRCGRLWPTPAPAG